MIFRVLLGSFVIGVFIVAVVPSVHAQENVTFSGHTGAVAWGFGDCVERFQHF